MKKAKLFLSTLFVLLAVSLSAQNMRVTGTVTDSQTGEGVPFASVVVMAVTSCFCASSTASDKPTYPTPATVIFMS